MILKSLGYDFFNIRLIPGSGCDFVVAIWSYLGMHTAWTEGGGLLDRCMGLVRRLLLGKARCDGTGVVEQRS